MIALDTNVLLYAWRQPTLGKDLLQCFHRGSHDCRANDPQSFYEPDLVQRSELVQKN